MKKIFKSIDEHFEEYIMGLFLIAISCIMLIQIFMRLIGASLSWAEELCRYFYLWSVFLSISFTIKKGIVLRVDLLLSKLNVNVQKAIEILLQMINIAVFTFLAFYAVRTVVGVKISLQTSPAMELPMYFVYSIIPISFFLVAIRSIQQIYLVVTNKFVKAEIDFSEAE
ncbi:MAG TPA: TRAP transporter small permease [Sedimentibacter sp.]|nr:TRAP transporter small permease [Sedimentibacter sp.]